ncbi:hypothetical protein Droror1_Dr00001724 [Drosera rotundifolia]
MPTSGTTGNRPAQGTTRINVSVMLTGEGEVSFSYGLARSVGIDLSSNLLHGEIASGLFSLPNVEYLNLSNNFLQGKVPIGIENMTSLRVLNLSHNALSGSLPDNVSSLKELTFLDLPYNRFSGFVSKTQGYWRFPTAIAGNPDLCIEVSDGKCKRSAIASVPGDESGDGLDRGPISAWILCVSAAVTFYLTLTALFCSPRTKNFILQT